MKKTAFIIVWLFAGMLSMSAQTVDELFKEYKDKKHVECIEIPKAMMAFAKGFVKNDGDGDIVKKINSMKVLTIENDADLCKEFASKATKLDKNGYETMVNSNEDNEKALILVKTKGETITEMVILSIEPSECTLVQLKGKLKSSDINKIH